MPGGLSGLSGLKGLSAMVGGPNGLAAQAATDGATQAYIFNEQSGNLIDQVGNKNLTVDGLVRRGITAPGGPDFLGYSCSGASTASSPFGHITGSRISFSGLTAWSCEVVFRVAGNFISGTKYAIDGETNGGFSLFVLSQAGTTLSVAINPTGNNSATLMTADSAWHHLVWGFNNGFHDAWVDGVRVVHAAYGNSNPTTDNGFFLDLGGIHGVGSTFGLPVDFDFLALYPLFPADAVITSHKTLSGV